MLRNPAIRKLLEKQQKKKKKAQKKPTAKKAKEEKFVVPDREPVDPNWFVEFIIKNDEELVNTEEARAMREKLARVDAQCSKLMLTEIDNLTYKDYEDLLEEADVREKVAMELMKHKKLHKTNIKELSVALAKTDKDVFEKLRRGALSYDQLKSRIAERRHNLKYVVLDDIAEQLKEIGLDITDDKRDRGDAAEAGQAKKT